MPKFFKDSVLEAMEKYKIYFAAEKGKVGVNVYHPVGNLTVLRFFPDSIRYGEDEYEDLSVAISYPNNYNTCVVALKELEDLVEDPHFNFAWLVLNTIVENRDTYFHEEQEA